MKSLKSATWPFVIGLLLGSAIALGFDLFSEGWINRNLELKLELDVLGFITFFVTVLIGYHLELVIKKDSESTSTVSGIITARLTKILEEVTDYQSFVANSKSFNHYTAIGIVQNCYYFHIDNLEKAISKFNGEEEKLIDFKKFKTKFEALTVAVQEHFTDQPETIPGQQPESERVGDDYRYSDSRVQLIIQSLSALISHLEELILDIATVKK